MKTKLAFVQQTQQDQTQAPPPPEAPTKQGKSQISSLTTRAFEMIKCSWAVSLCLLEKKIYDLKPFQPSIKLQSKSTSLETEPAPPARLPARISRPPSHNPKRILQDNDTRGAARP